MNLMHKPLIISDIFTLIIMSLGAPLFPFYCSIFSQQQQQNMMMYAVVN